MLKRIKQLFGAFARLSLKVIAISIVLLSVVLNGAHFIVNLLPDKNQFISAIATGVLNQSVAVKSARLEGSAIHPLVVLTDVSVNHQQVKQIKVGVNLWRSLINWQWTTDHVLVSDVFFLAQENEGQLKIPPDLVNWLMAQPDIAFSHVNLDWKNEQHKLLKIRQLALRFQNEEDKHIIAGNFLASQNPVSHIRFVLKAHAHGVSDSAAQGVFYLSGKNVNLSEWHAAVQPMFKIDESFDGKANVQLWAHFKRRQLQSVQAHVVLSHVSVGLQKSYWGVTPMTVNAIWFPTQHDIGMAQFQADHAKLSLSGLFSHQISDVNLAGSLLWVHRKQGWVIRLQRAHVYDQYLRFYGKSLVYWQDNQSPRVNFSGHAALSDVKQVARYLPDRVLHPKLDQWLTNALRQGSVANAKLLYQGSLHDFPFDNKAGHFEVSAQLKDVTLHFDKDWPAVSHLNGQLLFDNRGMRVTARHATLANLSVDQVVANMPNLTHPDLTVDAKTQVDLSDGIVFLRHSTLPIAKDMSLLAGNGPAAVSLTLRLPLYKRHTVPRVKGQVKFLNDTLRMQKWSLDLHRLTGQLFFSDHDFSSLGLSTYFMQKQFSLNVHTQLDKAKKKALAIDANGKVDSQQLSKKFLAPAQKMLQGESKVHVGMVLHDVSSPLKNTFAVFSNLKGISIHHVPSYFLKASDAVWPSRLQLVVHNSGAIDVSGAIGHLLSSQLLLKKSGQGISLISGVLNLGGVPAVLPKKNGFFVKGALPVVHVSQWKDWFEKNVKYKASSVNYFALPDYLKGIDLTIADLVVGDQHWRDLLLSVASQPSGTRIQMQNANVSGSVLLPIHANQSVRADFDYLFLLNASTKNSDALKNIAPTDLPPLDINISDFRLKNFSGGHIALMTKPMHDGLYIKKLGVTSSLINLGAKGRWIDQDGKSYTELSGHFNSDDLGELLLRRHLSSRLKGGVLATQFALGWPGSPTAYGLKTMRGKISVGLTEGRILQLDTETESNLEFGRFLNILSLESISKFLTFDFSSLTRKGFPFHTLTGDLKIQRGDVYTNNMEIEGPLAHISIKGDIGLTSKNNNLSLTISPYVSSSLPFLVGLAGGPIAGVATWLVNKMVAPSVGHMMSMHYHVSGTWQHPVVKKYELKKSA